MHDRLCVRRPCWLAALRARRRRRAARLAAGTQAPAAQENVIWASGKLLPARWAALSPATGGTVKALYPAEGDRVEAGTLLAEIDNGILQSQVEVAAAAVAEAEAARAKLLAGAAPADWPRPRRM